MSGRERPAPHCRPPRKPTRNEVQRATTSDGDCCDGGEDSNRDSEDSNRDSEDSNGDGEDSNGDGNGDGSGNGRATAAESRTFFNTRPKAPASKTERTARPP